MKGLDRLVVGLAWLKRAKPDSFDMGSWYVMRHREPGFSRLSLYQRLQTPSCRTSACAAGWMALCPTLRREGFELAVHPYDAFMWTPAFEGARSWRALELFFDLGFTDTIWLFDPSAYATGTLGQVCERFEAFIIERRAWLAKAKVERSLSSVSQE